jgi:hypothetical protein
MKKLSGFLIGVFLMLSVVGTANAVPLNESFYGTGDDGKFIDLWDGDSVTLGFDLTQLNLKMPMPTTDEYLYDPNTMSITDATLDFTFSSADCPGEDVTIIAEFYNGDTLIIEQDYKLGYWFLWNHREYADLSIDFKSDGLLDYLQDGMFDTIVLAAESDCCWHDNDFRLDKASITATGKERVPVPGPVPTPEPATMVLFGLGLLGLVGVTKKKLRK